jgi:hypothetical protein
MPTNDKDYMREYQQKRREKLKEQRELENPTPLKEHYMSWEEFHEKQPLLSFREYLAIKTEFEKPCPPCHPRYSTSGVKGGNTWSPTPDENDDETEFEKRARRNRRES